MKRTRLRRYTPLRAGKPLARGNGPVRRAPLRSTPSSRARPGEALATWCEAAIPGVCTGRAGHRHHIVRRSQGGSDDPSNTADLCAACHGWAHSNPEAARGRGLLARKGAA